MFIKCEKLWTGRKRNQDKKYMRKATGKEIKGYLNITTAVKGQKARWLGHSENGIANFKHKE